MNILISILIFSSCAFKEGRQEKEEVKKTWSFQKKNLKDSDGDGLIDTDDPNPFKAEFPTLSIREAQKVEIGLNHDRPLIIKYDNHPLRYSSKSYAFDKATRIIFGHLTGDRDLEDFDFGQNVLYSYRVDRDLSPKSFYPLKHQLESAHKLKASSGFFKAFYKLSYSYPQFVTSISEVVFHLDFEMKGEKENILRHKLARPFREVENVELPEGESLYKGPYSYRTVLQELDASKIRDLILSRGKIHLTLEDFNYPYRGKNLSFASVFSQVRDKNAQVIFTDDKGLTNYFIKSGTSLLKALEDMGHKVNSTRRGEILSINHRSTTLLPPVKSNLLRDEHAGLWRIIGADRGLKTILKAGKAYLVGYRTAGQLAHADRRIVEIFKKEKIRGGEVISELLPGDILEFEIEKIRRIPIRRKIRESRPCKCPFILYLDSGRKKIEWNDSTCEFDRFIFDRRDEAIPFSSDGVKHLLFEVGGQTVPLMQSEKNWTFVNNRKRVMASFLLTKEILQGVDEAKLIVEETPFPGSLELGFPNAHYHSEKDCYNSQLGLSQWTGNYEYHFIVTLKRIGMKRGGFQ